MKYIELYPVGFLTLLSGLALATGRGSGERERRRQTDRKRGREGGRDREREKERERKRKRRDYDFSSFLNFRESGNEAALQSWRYWFPVSHMHFLPPVASLVRPPRGVSFDPSSAFFCDGLAKGLPGAYPRSLAQILMATVDPKCPRMSPQPPRGSSGGSAPPLRARSWTYSRHSSLRLATLTSSCARRWRSRSTCQSPESRCGRLALQGQDKGARAGGSFEEGGLCEGGLTNWATPPRLLSLWARA